MSHDYILRPFRYKNVLLANRKIFLSISRDLIVYVNDSVSCVTCMQIRNRATLYLEN